MLTWLRRMLGESRDLADARVEIDLARALLEQARGEHQAVLADLCRADVRYARLTNENHQLRGRNTALQATFAKLIEPGPTDQCGKVRLRDRAEAEAFARSLENDLGQPPGAYVGYACKLCPRQPVTTGKFWHITAADPAQRGKSGRKTRGRRGGPGLVTHVDEGVMARLRLSAGGVSDG